MSIELFALLLFFGWIGFYFLRKEINAPKKRLVNFEIHIQTKEMGEGDFDAWPKKSEELRKVIFMTALPINNSEIHIGLRQPLIVDRLAFAEDNVFAYCKPIVVRESKFEYEVEEFLEIGWKVYKG